MKIFILIFVYGTLNVLITRIKINGKTRWIIWQKKNLVQMEAAIAACEVMLNWLIWGSSWTRNNVSEQSSQTLFRNIVPIQCWNKIPRCVQGFKIHKCINIRILDTFSDKGYTETIYLQNYRLVKALAQNRLFAYSLLINLLLFKATFQEKRDFF